MTIPDYIRRVYGVSPVPVVQHFAFLDRDAEEKSYNLGSTDKYVFNAVSFPGKFFNEANRLRDVINANAKELGLLLEEDKDRKALFVSGDSLQRAFDHVRAKAGISAEAKITAYESLFSVASANEIIKKVALQRTILPGWHIVSYDGKQSGNTAAFNNAIAILIEVMKRLRQTDRYVQAMKKVREGQGDPLDTTTGFPLYSAEYSPEQGPIAKLKTLLQYKGIGSGVRTWDGIREKVIARGRNEFERQFPFAVAPIRRVQPGYKWGKIWKRTSTGLVLDREERGHSTNRVAWMAPYLLNLLISPVQAEWKAFRMLIPGLYHDGPTHKVLLDGLRANPNLLIVESDFSNYDRTIPVDVTSAFFKAYSQLTNQPDYWYQALMQTQTNIPLIWGDHTSGGRGRGWVFVPKSIALLSGLKITSEVGTFMNLLVNIAGWIQTGFMSREAIIAYLTSTPAVPKVLIQSDDTSLIASSKEELTGLTESFRQGAKMAGISASIGVGDKFLMRNLYLGKDTPVSIRVWQNTLNNETPPEDAITFMVGLVVRTDGMLGFKTFDPFQTGTIRKITAITRNIEMEVLKSLLLFTSSANTPITSAVEFLKLMIAAGDRMIKVDGGYKILQDDYLTLMQVRKAALAALAAKSTAKSIQGVDAWIYQLYKDRQSPTASYTLDALIAGNAVLAKKISELAGLENQFYNYAMKTLGCLDSVV
jgi:hypothetical protein